MTDKSRIVSLIIGRSGSTLKNKNILPVLGRPLLPILRPKHLSLPQSQSVDVVRHTVEIITLEHPLDILVVQHANVGTIHKGIIDECIRQLLKDTSLSAVVPVHEKSEYHPYRAKTVDSEGLLQPFFDFGTTPVSGNRQDLPVCYFFDHSIWVLRVENSIYSEDGQAPWTCMGSRIKPYITKGCFDVHSLEDLKATEEWILHNRIELPEF